MAYFILGMALTAICATGTYIWLGKRERRGIGAPRIRAAWDAVVWGSPLILALAFVLRKTLGNDLPLVAIFWGEIGRAHVCTPVINAHLVCRLLLEKKNN